MSSYFEHLEELNKKKDTLIASLEALVVSQKTAIETAKLIIEAQRELIALLKERR